MITVKGRAEELRMSTRVGDVVICHDDGCKPCDDPREPCDCDALIVETVEASSTVCISSSANVSVRMVTRRRGLAGATCDEVVASDPELQRDVENERRRASEWKLLLGAETSEERREREIQLAMNVLGCKSTAYARAVAELMHRYGWKYDPGYGHIGEIAVNCGEPNIVMLEDEGWPVEKLERYLQCFTEHKPSRRGCEFCFRLDAWRRDSVAIHDTTGEQQDLPL